jgi:hypothetical protein
MLVSFYFFSFFRVASTTIIVKLYDQIKLPPFQMRQNWLDIVQVCLLPCNIIKIILGKRHYSNMIICYKIIHLLFYSI